MGVFDNVMSTAEAATGTLGVIPGVGEAMNAAGAVYHGGAAVYDGLHGDRDGAINHGAQAVWNGVGAIPGLPESVGQVDAAASGLATHARGGVTAMGGDATQVPGGIGDLLGSGAVALANGYFGADDSNWIAEGDRPTGTRGGEIAAGSEQVGALIGGAMLPGFGGELGGWAGRELGPMIGGVLGADVNGPTSGARGPNGEANGWAQSAGDWLHGSSAGRAASGAMLSVGASTLLGPLGGLVGPALPILDAFDF